MDEATLGMNCARAEFLKGSALYKLGRKTEALPLLENVRNSPGEDARLEAPLKSLMLEMMADIYIREGRRDEALQCLDEIAGASPTGSFAQAFYGGAAAFCRGHFQTALEHFERARQQRPDDPQVLRNIRECRRRLEPQPAPTGEPAPAP